MAIGTTDLHALSPDGENEAYLATLVEGICRQDEAALASFYDATVPRAYALVLRLARSPELTEDILSDVYLQVWQQAQRFDPDRGTVYAWLFIMCRSRTLDQLRRRDRAESHADPDSLRGEAHGSGGPLDLLIALDSSSAVHEAVSLLEEQQRQLLSMAFFHGLSHQEIATHTNMPLGTVKTVLRRAMHALKGRLDQYSPAPGGMQ